MSFAGSHHGRRRRRLAGGTEGLSGGADGDAGLRVPLAELLQRSLARRLMIPIPGLPQRLWVFWTAAVLMAVGTGLVLALLHESSRVPPVLQPLTLCLLSGKSPALLTCLEVGFWLGIAELSVLVGWCRSRSQLDFRGAYRIWLWGGLLFGGFAVCRATGLHVALADLTIEQTHWKIWRGSLSVWLWAAAIVSLLTVWRMGRDARDSRIARHFLRGGLLLVGVAGALHWAEPMLPAAVPWPVVATATRVFGELAGFLFMWAHLRHVVYVSADPPKLGADGEERQPRWRVIFNRVRGYKLGIPGLSIFVRKKPAAPAKKTRKKAAAKSEGTPTAKKTRKKATAKKATRTAKPRVRVEVAPEPEVEPTEVEEEYADESAGYEETYEEPAEESYEEPEPEAAADPEEDEWRQLEEMTRPQPEPASARDSHGSHANGKKGKNNNRYEEAEAEAEADDGEDSSGGEYYRVDEAESEGNQFRGMSKKQKREAKRQAREQNHDEGNNRRR